MSTSRDSAATRWVITSVCALAVAAILIGFLWLPSAQADFSAQGLWASICRAAGVPGRWGDNRDLAVVGERSTGVVLSQVISEGAGARGSEEAVGRGATLALSCTACHGAKGLSEVDAPNLAGQYAEVVVKQLRDYQRGDRASAVMQALAANLSEADMRALAAYYAELPKPRAVQADEPGRDAPALVRVGDPMRNIAPCASCHGGVGGKPGAPWLEGMPKAYLSVQLERFASGQRRNDSHGQMRTMARALSAAEIDNLAGFYARR